MLLLFFSSFFASLLVKRQPSPPETPALKEGLAGAKGAGFLLLRIKAKPPVPAGTQVSSRSQVHAACPGWASSSASPPGCHVCSLLRRVLLFIIIIIFLNLKIIWRCSSWVICCHCNICCVSDSHSRKPLFPFCQYLGICLAQEPADEDFLFVLSHCWSDKYTSALSSKRKETSCPELKGKICRNSTKGPCYHEASMEGWNWVTGAMTKAWFPY